MIIRETEYWKIELNSDQVYLGRCVIIAKRKVNSLSELTKEEWEDFSEIVKRLESTLKKVFGARMFNWTCLMNNAFKTERYENKIAEPHVHWHFRPRYNKPINFGNENFEDKEFAHHYDNKKHKEVSKELLTKIANKIKEGFK